MTIQDSGRLGGSVSNRYLKYASGEPDALAVKSQLVGAPTLYNTFRSVQHSVLSSKSCY